jgi:hypothetical protein
VALDWTQLTLLVTAGATAFGSSLGIPLANALRRPGIDKAIDKRVEAADVALTARIDELEKLFVGRGAEIVFLKQRVQFLEGAILGWRPRAAETPAPPALAAPGEPEAPK